MGHFLLTTGDNDQSRRTMIPTSNNEQGPAAAALLLLLLGTATAVTAVKPSSPLTRTIEILSDPITLKYGQVNNRYQEPISLPEDVVAQFANNKTMAIVDYKVDIVDEDGNQVPLYDIYNHHYNLVLGSHDFAEGVYNFTKDAPYGVPPPKDLVGWVNENASFSQPDDYYRNEGRRLMMMTSMMSMSSSLYDFDFSAGFGGGSGAEERGTSHKLPDGYAWMIHQPEAMTALFHFINTRAPQPSPGAAQGGRDQQAPRVSLHPPEGHRCRQRVSRWRQPLPTLRHLQCPAHARQPLLPDIHLPGRMALLRGWSLRH